MNRQDISAFFKSLLDDSGAQESLKNAGSESNFFDTLMAMARERGLSFNRMELAAAIPGSGAMPMKDPKTEGLSNQDLPWCWNLYSPPGGDPPSGDPPSN